MRGEGWARREGKMGERVELGGREEWGMKSDLILRSTYYYSCIC